MKTGIVKIQGNWAPLLLPINDDESIDYSRLSDEIDYLISSRVSGIYSNGTAGEFFTQTEDEFEKINSILAYKCKKAGMSFQIGASHMSPQISLLRLKKAVMLEPSAIQVIMPDWIPVSDEAAINFLRRMSQSAESIGLVIYNPGHSKRVLDLHVFQKLKSSVPNLIGIKVSGGNEQWYKDVKELIPNVSVFIPGHLMATGIKNGAHGSYSNVAGISPSGTQRWYEIIRNDINNGLEIEKNIIYFMKEYILPYIIKYGYPDYACDKLLAAIGGWADIGTRLRWPYKWIPESDAKMLQPIARKLIPQLFDGLD